MSSPIRITGILVGDIRRMPDMRVKYGLFFEALARRFDVVDIIDASLRGVPRYWNALTTFSPSVSIWKERFFKNVPAFQMRSRLAVRALEKLKDKTDVVLQVGALLNPCAAEWSLPLAIYTDNTTRISARHPGGRRVGLSPHELDKWLEHEKRLYRAADHIFVRAEVVKASLVEEYGVYSSTISVVGGGVNFAPLPVSVERNPDRPPTILFIGEGFYRKGGDLLLRAFAQARTQVPEARLLIVTRDPMPEGYSLENVEVHPVTWQREVIAEYYRRADIFVLPSRLETWGDVLLEAMAFGLPCVGVQGQAMEDIIQHEVTGLLVSHTQTNSLAGALIRLLTQPRLREQMGRAARSLVESQFKWDSVVQRLEPALNSMVVTGSFR